MSGREEVALAESHHRAAGNSRLRTCEEIGETKGVSRKDAKSAKKSRELHLCDSARLSAFARSFSFLHTLSGILERHGACR